MADGTIKILTELATDGLKSGLKAATAMITGAAATLGALGTAAIKVGSKFESGMSQVAATMGITKDTIDDKGVKPFEVLSKAAKDAGASTKYSASEAAEGLNYLALAGYSAEQSAEALPVVLNLAAAGGLDLAYASDLATDAMAALGIEANKKNLTEFGDKMAKTASKANTSVGQLGEAILTVGGTAKGLAGGTTELNAALGVLANRGIKGAEGGTALRNVILALSAPTDKAAGALKSLGVEVNDAEGNMRPLNDVFTDLNTSLADMSESERTQVLNEIFNKVDLKSAQALLAGCGDEFDNLALAIDNSDGAMQQMADTMNDNLNGQVTILKSALEGLGIELYESVQEPLKNLAKEGTELVGQLTTAFKEGGFTGLAEEVGNVLSTIVTKITKAAPKIIDAAAGMINGLLSGIEKNLPSIVEGAVKTVGSFIKGIASVLPKLVKTGISLINELTKGIAKQLPELIPVAVDAVLELVSTIAKNVPEMVKAGVELIRGLLKGILAAIPQIIAALPQLIDAILNGILEAIPLIIAAAIEFFMAIVEAIPVIIQALVAALPDIITTIIDFLIQAVPMLIDGAIQLFMAIIQAIPTIIVELVKAIPQIIAAIVEGLLNGIGQIFGAAVELFSPIGQGLEETNKAFDETIVKAGEFGQAMKDASPDLMEYNSLLSGTGKSIRDIDTAVDESEAAITEILKTALAEQQGLRDQDIENIRKYMDDINALQMEKLEIYRSQQIGTLERLKVEKETLTTEEMAQHNANVQAALDEANKIVDEACTNELAILYNKHQAAGTLNSVAYEVERKACVEKWNAEKEINQQNANEALGIMTESAAKQVNVEKDKWDSMSAFTDKLSKENLSDFQWWCMKMSGQSAILEKTYKDSLNEMDLKTASAFLSMAASTAKGGQKLDEKTKATARAILTNFDNLPDELDTAGKDALLGMISGIEDQIPGLGDTSKMSADEIVEAIRTALDCHSPSKVTEGIGKNTMEGLAGGIKDNVKSVVDAMRNVGTQIASGMKSGMQSQLSSLLATARSIADKVTKAFKARLDIHSPSRRIAKEVGKPTAQGVGVGFKQAIPGVMRDIGRSLDLELGKVPMGALSVQHQIKASSEPSTGFGKVYNITNNVESPVPITVAESAREANRLTEDTLFKLGVYGV